MREAEKAQDLKFLEGGGEMGALTRAYPWEQTPVGRPQDWPQSLKTTVRLLLTSHHPMFIWWGPELIQFYNDAYRRTMGPERHPSALGQRGRDCWQEIWEIIGPQIELVMRGEGATWHEDQYVPVTRFGRREDVWWTYGYSPIDDGDGRVGGVLVVCNDVTVRHKAAERLRELFAQAPGFVAILRGPDHVFDLCNDSYRALGGGRELVGRRLAEAMPEVVEQGFIDILDEVYRTGEAFAASGRPIMLDSGSGKLEQRYLDFVYQPIFGDDGSVEQIFVLGHDVTEEKLASEHRQMLAAELGHRVKNMLAIVQAIANQTFHDDVEPQTARAAFSARIMALAASQDVLTSERWQGADITAVVHNSLAHHGGDGQHIAIDGPSLMLPPRTVTALAMALHELSTNAAKYGALSRPGGRVGLTWTVTAEAEGRRLHLVWRESGGPPVTPPERLGFGTRLIKSGLAADLGGEAHIDYDAAGLVCTIDAVLGDHHE